MLVLTRLKGEAIMIGDDIKVTVCKIENGKVRLGIEADQSIPVYRGEIYERIAEVREPE